MESSPKPNKYFAFISYKREDEEWAIWFQHELENYHLPVTLNGRPDLPKEFRPVFRDIDELKAGNLPEQIYNALASSSYLVVICSPNSAKSKWVNKEITDFVEIGKTKGVDNIRNIFPFIVEGHPHADKDAEECFPKALLDLPDNMEIVGGNVNECGRDKSFVKVLAGMLPCVAFDELWDRYERDRAEALRVELEKRDKLLIAQSRFVAEKAMAMAEENSYLARLLAIEVLPDDLENPDRPFTAEAERALRMAMLTDSAIFQGHPDNEVRCVAMHPDGKIFASVSPDFLFVWELETGKVLFSKTLSEDVFNSIAFSNDGSMMVYVSDYSIVILDPLTGKSIKRFSEDEFHIYYSAVFGPDDKTLLLVSGYNNIVVLDIEKRKFVGSFFNGRTHTWSYSAAYSHNGELISIASERENVTVWDAKSYQLVKTFPISGRCAVFSKDDRFLYTISKNEIFFRVWDLQSGEYETLESGNDSEITAVALGYGNDRVITGAKDGTVCVWDVSNKRILFKVKYPESVNSLACVPDRNIIVVALNDKTVRVMGEKRNPLHYELQNNISEVQMVELDKNRGFAMAISESDVYMWNLQTGKCVRKEKCASYECITSPDGRYYLTGKTHYEFEGSNATITARLYKIQLRDMDTGELIRDFNGYHSDIITNIAFSDSGRLLASSSWDGSVMLWEVESGNCIREFHHKGKVHIVTFSKDESKLFSESNGIYVWDVESGNLDRFIPIPNTMVCSLQISQNDKYLLVNGSVNDVYIFSTDRWNCFSIKSEGMYLSMLTPDSRFILTGKGDKVIVRDIESGRILRELRGHKLNIVCGACSSDSKYIATASMDKTIRVWEIKSGLCVEEFSYDSEVVHTIKFHKDGSTLISGHSFGNICIWDFQPLQNLIDETRKRFESRPLTDEERKLYYLE